MIRKIVLNLIGIAFTFLPVFAQNNATSMGFGYNYRPFASGVDAFKLNPSRLAYNEQIEISFISLNTAVSNSSFSVSNLNQYFSEEGNGGEWTDTEKNEVLDLVNEVGIQSYVDFNVFSIAYKNMGFGIDLVSNGGVDIVTKKFAKIALFGENLDYGYTISEPELGKGAFFSAVRYSYAYSQLVQKRFYPLLLKNITVGGKLSYYHGIAVAEILDSDILFKRRSSNGTLDRLTIEYNMDVRARTAVPDDNHVFNGGGIGLDVAASATFMDDWHFSLMLENLIGSITWDGNTEITRFVRYDSSFVTNEFDDGVDRNVEYDTTRSTKDFSTRLPANLYLGAYYQLLKNLTLTAQYKQGLSEDFGNTFTPQIGAGAEYRPIPWLPLRMGMTVGGRNTFLLGLGTGVDLGGFKFNLSYAMREGLWPSYSNGVFFAWDFKVML